jgi:hypothetical protein
VTAAELVGGTSDGILVELTIIEPVPVWCTPGDPTVVFQPGVVPTPTDRSSALLCYWYTPEPYRDRRVGLPIRMRCQPLHPAQGAP